MGARSSWIAMEIARLLANHIRSTNSGWVFSNMGYMCMPGSPNVIKRPAISYVRFGRIPGDMLPIGTLPLAPDLAVEVVEPSDLAYDIQRTAEVYMDAGVGSLWLVYPETRQLRIHRSDRTIIGLNEEDRLMDDPTVPEFQCQVCDFFSLPLPDETMRSLLEVE